MEKTGLEAIYHLVKQKKAIDLAKGHIHDVRARLKHAINDESRLGELLNDKYDSVEDLKSSSLRNLFKSILGSHKDEIEMERQEYLQVVLQYNDARKRIELLEYELEVLKNQIVEEQSITERLDIAIREHRGLILKKYPKVALSVGEIEEDIKEQLGNQKELEEALEVGEALLLLLTDISKLLDKAADWGDWNEKEFSRKLELKSKNLFIDKAMIKVYEAQMLFEKFDKELQDIHEHKRIIGTYHFQDFGSFSKVYYNRLIADWVIQKQIKNTQSNIDNVQCSVQLIVNTLRHEINQTNEFIVAKSGEIKKLIELSIDNF